MIAADLTGVAIRAPMTGLLECESFLSECAAEVAIEEARTGEVTIEPLECGSFLRGCAVEAILGLVAEIHAPIQAVLATEVDRDHRHQNRVPESQLICRTNTKTAIETWTAKLVCMNGNERH